MASARRPAHPPDALPELYSRLVTAIRARWREADVEDVVQDAFLRLSIAEGRAEILDRPAFLYVTALNLIRDRLRSEAARGTLLVDAVSLDRITSEDPSSERILAGREHLAIVDAAIAELPPSARTALMRYRLDNLPQAQIAEELHVSVSMVEKHVRRALTHCRNRLAEADSAAEPGQLTPPPVARPCAR